MVQAISLRRPRPRPRYLSSSIERQNELIVLPQTSQYLQDYQARFPDINRLILEYECAPDLHQPCACSRGSRVIQCNDCLQYETSCEDCFIESHRNNPVHWAEKWSTYDSGGFFVRYDISNLKGPKTTTIQLGHSGRPCPNAGNSIGFTLVHSNGIHATQIAFCYCHGTPDRVEQLMRARLFPGTVREPNTVFTVAVMKEFDLFHLEGKLNTYDYIGALRRLSDNAFSQSIPVCGS